jgi:hypothetical protein
MVKSRRCGVFRVKETIMTTSKLAAALAIALATTAGFAVGADNAVAADNQAVTHDPFNTLQEFKMGSGRTGKL